MTKVVHVAVGVLLSNSNEVLIALRGADQHQGGLWEFPGGKVEKGESTSAALARELHEELAISCAVDSMTPLIKIQHDYSDKSVLLDVWVVRQFTGEAIGNEGQPVRWVDSDQLCNFEFPEANKPIIDALVHHLHQQTV